MSTTTTTSTWALGPDPFLTGPPISPVDPDAVVELIDAGLFYCGRSFRHARHEVTHRGQDVWCSGRRHGTVRPAPRHRAAVRVLHRAYPLDFRPAHCAGTDCLGHAHPGEVVLPVWSTDGEASA